MSNKIPPLLSHTPPPIDFDDNEKYDDFRGFESSDIYDYGEISLPETPVKQQKILEVDELCPLPIVPILPVTPIPDVGEISTKVPGTQDIVEVEQNYVLDNVNVDDDDDENVPKIYEKKTEDDKVIENLEIKNIVKEIDKVYVEDVIDDENDNVFNYRGESPPSLILSQDNFSDNDFNNDDDDDDDLDNEVAVNFNKFNYNENDSNSIPSLKLDSNNDSKCVTPQSLNDNSLTTSLTAVTPSPVAVVELKQEEKVLDENNLKVLITDETITVDKTISIDNVIRHNDDIDNDFNDDDFDNISSFDTLPTFNADDKTLNFFASNDIEEEINWNDDSDKNDNDDMFVADFSQFNNNNSNDIVIDNQEIVIDNDDFVNKIKNLDNENFDDDDFDDFVDSNDVIVKENATVSSTAIATTDMSTDIANQDNDNDFDDDFDDFQKNEIITEPTLNTFKTIIEKVFLLNELSNFPNKNDENNNNNNSISDNSCNKLNNNLLLTIKDFDGAKALNYQWLNSSSNQTLITSLGIDSRNILYGTRWNSSMPRFAANLGFSPLEPLKPSTISSTSSNSILSTTLSTGKSIKQQDIMSTSTIATMSHPLSPTVTSSSTSDNPMVFSNSSNNLQITNTDVPAAQFDWNSSGLVNPLDDVQEFLNKAGTTEIKQSRKEIINENDNNDDRTETSKIIGITTSPAKVATTAAASTAAAAINFSAPASLSIQQEYNTTQLNNENNFTTILPLAMSFGGGTIDLTSTGGTTSVVLPPLTTTTTNPCNKTTLRETHIFTPNKGTSPISRELNDNNSNINDDASSIGGYNNREIIINDKKAITTSSIMIDKKVIIKEYRDVEYNPDKILNNSINLNDKINNEATGDNAVDDDDEFTEFKNYPTISAVPKQQTILQPTIISNNELNINWPEPGYNNINCNNNNSYNECNLEEGLENYKLNKLKKENESKAIDKNKANDGDSGGDSVAVAVAAVDETNKNDDSFNDYQQSVNSISNDDEFCDFQFVPTIPVQQTVAPVETTLNKSLFSLQQQHQQVPTIPILIPTQQQQQPLQQQSKVFNCPILEPTTMNFEQKPSTTIDYKTNDILTLNSSESVFEPKINWGNTSNINPDELARIEAIFPKQTVKQLSTKTASGDNQKMINNNNKSIKDDVEWSDFVSVDDLSVKTPNNLNNNNNNSPIVRHSLQSSVNKVNTSNSIDDDWNDFVSIPPSINVNTQPVRQQQWNLQYNLNQGPKFTSWNAPSATTQEINQSWNFNKQQPLSPLNFNSTNSNNNNNGNNNNNNKNQLPMLKQFNQMSIGSGSLSTLGPTVVAAAGGIGTTVTTQSTKPSISLIPDLGFVVPKMFNLSNQQQQQHHQQQHQQQKYQQFNYHNSNNHNSKK